MLGRGVKQNLLMETLFKINNNDQKTCYTCGRNNCKCKGLIPQAELIWIKWIFSEELCCLLPETIFIIWEKKISVNCYKIL